MEFDCQKCGACCTYFHKDELKENNYPLWAVPINPNFDKVPPQFVQIGKRVIACDSQDDADNGISYETSKFVRPDGLRCSALAGEIGKDVSCAIYVNRPPVCRNFEVGSERCIEARNAEL